LPRAVLVIACPRGRLLREPLRPGR